MQAGWQQLSRAVTDAVPEHVEHPVLGDGQLGAARVAADGRRRHETEGGF